MSPSLVGQAVKKVAAALKEAMDLASVITDLQSKLVDIDEQLVSLRSNAIINYIAIPEHVIRRTIENVLSNRERVKSELDGQVAKVLSIAKRLQQLPGPEVEIFLSGRVSDVMSLGTPPRTTMVRAAQLIDWIVQVKDGVARESATLQADHAHYQLFMHNHHLPADTVALVMQTAAYLA